MRALVSIRREDLIIVRSGSRFAVPLINTSTFVSDNLDPLATRLGVDACDQSRSFVGPVARADRREARLRPDGLSQVFDGSNSVGN